GGPGGRRDAQSAAGGVPRASRLAVRLLHAGLPDDADVLAPRVPEPVGDADPRDDLRQSLPLHGLREHRDGGPRRRAVAHRDRMTPAVGRSVRRIEDRRLLTGRGKYAADFRLPGMLQGAVLRSPHAHARLGEIRPKAALALPGVVAVVTAENLGDVGQIPTRLGHRVGNVACLQRPLARDKVRYVGEPVAFIVAESRYLAEDALDVMEVDYDPLPIVADAWRAMESGAPLL